MAIDILVFVPGTLGSELWLREERVWPGTPIEALSGMKEDRFAKLLRSDLQVGDIVRSAVGGLIDIYGSWIKAFTSIVRDHGILFREQASSSGPKTLYLFPYDWRRDLAETAGKLADLVDTIVTAVPNANINLVCHSMGGIIARYYLESHKFEYREAFQKVSLLATFGTPHNGAPVAYAGAIGLHKADFLSVSQTTRMANDSRYPSLYQLFPSPNQSFIWAHEPEMALQDYAADDSNLVRSFSLNSNNLKAWRDFRAGLTGSRPRNIRYFYVVGSRQRTLARFELRDYLTVPILTKTEIDEAGDGTVPLLGAMEPMTQSQLVGKSHVSLIDSKDARTVLAALFRGSTLFADDALPRPTVTVRDSVVDTTVPIFVLIEFSPGVSHFAGELTFELAQEPAEDGTPMAPVFSPFPSAPVMPIEIQGGNFTHITLMATALEYRGVYRPVLSVRSSEHTMANRSVGPAFAVQLVLDERENHS